MGTQYCAYEASTSCGCTSCDLASVNSFRVSDCSLTTCARRLVAETTDLEEAAPATAQWGRRRRRFFDYRRRRRRFFDYRRRRRRTPYPTPFPTPSPTGILAHKTCKHTYCTTRTASLTSTPWATT